MQSENEATARLILRRAAEATLRHLANPDHDVRTLAKAQEQNALLALAELGDPNGHGGRRSNAGRKRKPVESAKNWWPDSEEAAAALGVSVNHVRAVCAGWSRSGRVNGLVVRYSPHGTREGWRAARAAAPPPQHERVA